MRYRSERPRIDAPSKGEAERLTAAKNGFEGGVILYRLEMTSALCFHAFTAISVRFRVSIRNLEDRVFGSRFFCVCVGRVHWQFPAPA
jgi:hypothetical protein